MEGLEVLHWAGWGLMLALLVVCVFFVLALRDRHRSNGMKGAAG